MGKSCGCAEVPARPPSTRKEAALNGMAATFKHFPIFGHENMRSVF